MILRWIDRNIDSIVAFIGRAIFLIVSLTAIFAVGHALQLDDFLIGYLCGAVFFFVMCMADMADMKVKSETAIKKRMKDVAQERRSGSAFPNMCRKRITPDRQHRFSSPNGRSKRSNSPSSWRSAGMCCAPTSSTSISIIAAGSPSITAGCNC